MQSITIKDIAHLAEVSVTTVSRALNNAPEISPETRARVLKICQEKGYRTNLLARSLSSSRTNVIGVIIPDISNPFHAALALHIEAAARVRGYQVMLCGARPGDGLIDDVFQFLISQRVDGILLSDSNNTGSELLEKYCSDTAAVLLGGCGLENSGIRVNSVGTDNYAGGRMAAEYLHGLGHRQVVYLGLRQGSFTHAMRHEGFQTRAEELGMEVTTLENPEGGSTIQNGHRLAKALFTEPCRQTAIFAVADTAALGVLEAADEAGISVPGDISLLGYDNIDYASLPNIRLTTVAQPIPRIAQASVELLLELVNEEDHREYTRKLLMPYLIERRTCCPPGRR